jgi:hypothetical protein
MARRVVPATHRVVGLLSFGVEATHVSCVVVSSFPVDLLRGCLVQNGFWFFKLLLWIGLTVAAFFIPNVWFTESWGYIALAGAFLYMIIQVKNSPLL